MTFLPTKTHLLAASLCAALAACGGSDDDSSTPATPAVATFASCFDVTAGVAYTTTDEGGTPDGVLMVRESFNGVVRNGSVELPDGGSTRGFATYWSQESNGIRFWGTLDYNGDGTVLSTTLSSSGFVLPLNLRAGQAAPLSFTDTTSYQSGPEAGQTETTARAETWTFVGFETLTLGGRAFTDTCRISIAQANPGEDGPSTLWFAKGFGVIRARHTNSAGAVLEETSLETITAQP